MSTRIDSSAVHYRIDVAAVEIRGQIVMGHIDGCAYSSSGDYQISGGKLLQGEPSVRTSLVAIVLKLLGKGTFVAPIGTCGAPEQTLAGLPPSTLHIAVIRELAAPSTACATPVVGSFRSDPIVVQFPTPSRSAGENCDPAWDVVPISH